jgi:MFS family permease
MSAMLADEPLEPSLWRNPAFVRLWIARAISTLGSRMTATAIPLVAAITLEASPQQMAWLVIAGQLPDVLFGLVAGAWVDRGRRGSLLAGAEIGRAAALAMIPLAAALGVLTFPLLWMVAFTSGVLGLIFSIASVAILPAVVTRAQIIDANAKLSMSDAVVGVVAPGLGGGLIQLIGAPRAILAQTVSAFTSGMSLRGIARSEPTRESPSRSGGLWGEIRDGLRQTVATPILRALTMASAVFAIGLAMQATVTILYLTRDLGMSPAAIGLITVCGGLGSVVGAAVASRVAKRIGAGMAIIGGTLLEVVAAIAVPVAGMFPLTLAILFGGQLVNGFGVSVYSVNNVSLRQQIVAPEFLGRITSARRFLTFCVAPVGALLGGWLGSAIGLGPTLAVTTGVLALGVVVMWRSPIRSVSAFQSSALQAVAGQLPDGVESVRLYESYLRTFQINTGRA